MRVDSKIVLLSLGFGITYWILEAFITSRMLHHTSMVDEIYSPSAHETSMRLTTCLLFVIFGGVAGYLVQKHKEARIESEEKSQALKIAETVSQTGSWHLDLGSNELQWSEEVYRIFGCQEGEFELSYDNFLKFVHPNDIEMVDREYTRSLNNHKHRYDIEHRIIRPDGQIRYVREVCKHIKLNGNKSWHSFGAVQDITERKQLEESHKELEKNIIYKAMAHSSQHILNNLLNSLLYFKQAAQNCKDFDEKKLTMLEHAMQNTEELIQKLSSIEDVSDENIYASVNICNECRSTISHTSAD